MTTTQALSRAPVSFAQQRLWLLDRLLPKSATYNIVNVVRLRGTLDITALRAALTELVHRHAALRTRFSSEDGVPMQCIDEAGEVELPVHEVRDADEAHRAAEAAISIPFDLERGPLLRARLLAVADNEHWLVLVFHHIVTDGWSSGIIRRELSALYGTFRTGAASPLAPLTLQYADYAVRQREWLQGEVLREQLAYWQRALAALPNLELPTDRPRPRIGSFQGRRTEFVIDPVGTEGLKSLARSEGATLFMVLLAALEVLLYRYSGQDDFGIGVPIAGRNRLEFEGLVGFFVNTLVLRADLSGAPTFRECLALVKARALDAYAHQDVPFERLVEDLAPQRDLSRNPLFQVSFTLDNTPDANWNMTGLEVERLTGIATQTAKFDLGVFAVQERRGLVFRLEYPTDLFEATTIDALALNFQTLLKGIVAQPETSVTLLPLLNPAQRRQLLVQWNGAFSDYPAGQCVYRLIEAQVASSPNAVAVVYEDQLFTYAALNAAANQLAHHLVHLGVGTGRSGRHLPRALAGSAHWGAGHSQGRRRLRAARSRLPGGPPGIHARGYQGAGAADAVRLLERFPEYAGNSSVWTPIGEIIALQPKHDPPCRATGENLAYVIYTSGSTGQPKGVMIEQRSLLNYVLWLQRAFPLVAGDRVLQSTPANFDISTLELFWPLVAGASLVITPPGAHRSPVTLINLVKRAQITVLQGVPSMLRAMSRNPDSRRRDRCASCSARAKCSLRSSSGASTRNRRPSWSMLTVQPKQPFTRRSGIVSVTARGRRCPSGDRLRTRRSTCWIPMTSRCRRVSPGSCASEAPGWPVAIGIDLSSLPSGSCPIHSAPGPVPGCIAPGIARASCRRQPRVPGAPRLPGQAARLSHRAR